MHAIFTNQIPDIMHFNDEIHKKQKFGVFNIFQSQGKVSLTRWSIFLFLDVPTLKLGIFVIILSTNQLEIILPTARTTKNKLPSPTELF